MALTNYSDLQAAVASWLNRSDLTAQIPDFITLAEARIKRLVRRKTTRASFSLTSGAVTLPAGELRSIRLDTGTVSGDWPIAIMSPDEFYERRSAYGASGRPKAAAVVDGTLLLAPAPDTTYTAEIVYYPTLAALSGGTNWLMTEAPDIYLYAALVEASPFLQHDERVPLWKQQLEEKIDELNLVREREEYGASFRPIRLPVRF